MDKRSNIGTRDFLTSHFLLTWSLPCNTFLLSFKEYFYSVYFVSCSMQTILHFRQRLQRDFLKAALLKVSSRNEVYTTLSDSTISCREKVFVATNQLWKCSLCPSSCEQFLKLHWVFNNLKYFPCCLSGPSFEAYLVLQCSFSLSVDDSWFPTLPRFLSNYTEGIFTKRGDTQSSVIQL